MHDSFSLSIETIAIAHIRKRWVDVAAVQPVAAPVRQESRYARRLTSRARPESVPEAGNLWELWPDVAALLAFTFVMMTLAILQFRKRLD